MVFTIVTAIFLPMSFIAALFAIPVREFPQASNGAPSLSFGFVSKFVFGIGLAISVPIITVAFAVDDLKLLVGKTLKRLGGKGRARQAAAVAKTKMHEDKMEQAAARMASSATCNATQQRMPPKQRRLRLSNGRHGMSEIRGVTQCNSDLEKGSPLRAEG